MRCLIRLLRSFIQLVSYKEFVANRSLLIKLFFDFYCFPNSISDKLVDLCLATIHRYEKLYLNLVVLNNYFKIMVPARDVFVGVSGGIQPPAHNG